MTVTATSGTAAQLSRTEALATSDTTRKNDIERIASAVHRTLRTNPNSRISNADIRERWGQKSGALLDFWSSREAQQFFASCVGYLNCDIAGNWPDRTFHQVADIAVWTQILTADGTIAGPKGDWAKAIEMALVGIELAPNSTIGAPDEHMQAARNTAAHAGYAGFPRSLALKVQALIACSSRKGLPLEQILTDPDKAREATKTFIYGHDPAWFANAAERRAFAEALLLTKLSDASRGQHGRDAATLASSRMGTCAMLQIYRAAAKAT